MNFKVGLLLTFIYYRLIISSSHAIADLVLLSGEKDKSDYHLFLFNGVLSHINHYSIKNVVH